MKTIKKKVNTAHGIDQAEKDLGKMIAKISEYNPNKWITYHVGMGEGKGNFICEIYIHNRKPQSTNTAGAENCYRRHGGFFKDGKVIKPSPSFVKRFRFCPVSR